MSNWLEWNKVRLEMIKTIQEDVEAMTPEQLEKVNDLVHKIREEEYQNGQHREMKSNGNNS